MNSYVEIARGELHAKLRDAPPSALSRVARNSSRTSFADSSKTAEYQRSDFKICNILRGITCEINADWFRDAVSNAVSSPGLAARLVLAVRVFGVGMSVRPAAASVADTGGRGLGYQERQRAAAGRRSGYLPGGKRASG